MVGRGDETLPGVAADDEDRIVLHVDVDCFYASCERLRDPSLEGEPVVVGMGYEPGDTVGAVATASYEAREFGVESAQAISTALERLPRRVDAESDPDLDPQQTGHYRPVDMDFYQEVSADVKAILHECADVVREVSIDEAYLDVTDRTAWDVAEGFARHVKDRIHREVGVTASVGVAPTMSVAKIASDFEKPDGLVIVEPDRLQTFLDPLDVELLHGVGPVTARELRELEIETAGDLARANRREIVDRFGERGGELWDRARGADDRQVQPTGRPKSLNRESAFAEAIEEAAPKEERIRTLAEAVAERAQRAGALYRTIGVKAVTPPYEVHTRERSLPGPVDDPELVERVAVSLFEEFVDQPVRKLGVRVSNLSFDGGAQSNLEGWAGERPEAGDSPAEADGSFGETGASREGDSFDEADPIDEADSFDETDSFDGDGAPDEDESVEGFQPATRDGQSTLAEFVDAGPQT